MERVLKPFPPDDNMGQQMDEVDGIISAERPVQSQPAVVRRRPWGTRRRTRSTGSLPFTWYQKASDDSSSSVGGEWICNRDKKISSLHQSDSDDVSGVQTSGALFNLQSRHLQRQLAGNMESDSVNENFSPIRPNTRRYFTKRKFKRMAVDVEMASTSRPNLVLPCVGPPGSLAGKKKRVLRHNTNCENRFCGSTQILAGASGKRKRSSHHHHHHHHHHGHHHHHHRSKTESESASSPRVLGLQRLTIRDEFPEPAVVIAMETNITTTATTAATPAPSNSSLSSSESDTGIFTNDEGREGDDEQSDWFGESGVGAAGGGAGGRSVWEDSDRDEDMEPTFQALLAGNLDLAEEARQRCHLLRDRLGRGHREIRGGRRRVRSEKPGFSVLTSANEKLSKFLQDPAQSELRLHPMQKTERDQLGYLAELYSLNMKLTETSHKGFTCPILTKTSNTMRVEHVSLGRLSTLGDFKRRRKIPPCGSLFNGTETVANCDNNSSSSITASLPQAKVPDALSSFDNRSS